MNIYNIIEKGELLDAEQFAKIIGGENDTNNNILICSCGSKNHDNENETSVSSCGETMPINDKRTCGEKVNPPVSPEPLEPKEP